MIQKVDKGTHCQKMSLAKCLPGFEKGLDVYMAIRLPRVTITLNKCFERDINHQASENKPIPKYLGGR